MEVTLFNTDSLNYSALIGGYETFLSVDNRSVKITVLTEPHSDLDLFNKQLSARIIAILNNQGQVLTYCANELLATKNENWLEDGERILNEERFKRNLHLRAINLLNNGDITLIYNPGKMFWGHVVTVGLNEVLEIQYAGLEG